MAAEPEQTIFRQDRLIVFEINIPFFAICDLGDCQTGLMIDRQAWHLHKQAVRVVFFILLGWAATTNLVCADEHLASLEAGGATYTNVTVTSVSATDVYFTYDHGMGNAKLKNLSPAWQKHFRFNPAKADAALQKQAAANQQYQIERQNNIGTGAAHRNEAAEDNGANAIDRRMDGPVANKKIWAKSYLNQKAPELVVEKWVTSQPDCSGKFVLIDFWATWCPPCRRAIPELNGYFQKFGDKLVVIGITDENEEAVRKLIDPKIEYYVAIDTQARTKNTLEVTGIPHVLLIDPQGIVRWEGYPFLENFPLTEKVVADVIARYSH